MEKCGLDELVAHSREEYITKFVKLAENTDYRESLSTKILELDLPRLLSNEFDADVFRRAIDFVIANHDDLQCGAGKPIIIE